MGDKEVGLDHVMDIRGGHEMRSYHTLCPSESITMEKALNNQVDKMT